MPSAETRRRIKLSRAVISRRLGSTRYSRPALHDLDRLLEDFLPESGSFLEIGANDGYSQSNTYHLEIEQGWQGILIEPLPRLFHTCARIRPRSQCFNVACVSPTDIAATISVMDRGLMSVALGLQTLEAEARRVGPATQYVQVPAETLSGVIKRSSFDRVTFMSIDVEGAEIAVLKGLDLPKHCPQWLLVETDSPDGVAARLRGHMLLRSQLTFHDFLFQAV